MESSFIELEALQDNPNFKEVVNGVLDDRLTFKDGLESLRGSKLFSLTEGGDLVGFYSEDELEGCVEIHMYMFQEHRRHSLRALRHIFKSQTGNIKTSVYGTHLHVVTFLKRLGFEVTNILEECLVKNGETYDVLELLFTKEKNNG
ncbi:MAG: GNAT family N-acetyltransferase [Cetobacterium sp.]|uniref:GNAT family N-acetyltransferase n=1 Tax=Cetobacterium sp. TaxID=2071632 RepID=UPI003EE6079E